jgi:hypothetical protein
LNSLKAFEECEWVHNSLLNPNSFILLVETISRFESDLHERLLKSDKWLLAAFFKGFRANPGSGLTNMTRGIARPV